VIPGTCASPAMSISLSKWPTLPTIALCFIRAMSAARMMSRLPVVVMNRSASRPHRQFHDLQALHGGLQRADRVDLGDHHPRTLATQTFGGALTDIAVAADHGQLAAQHHVGGPVDAVGEGVPDAVLVVELGLVTESFTLIAGNSSTPVSASLYSRLTPLVVSSETPLIRSASRVNRFGSVARLRAGCPG